MNVIILHANVYAIFTASGGNPSPSNFKVRVGEHNFNGNEPSQADIEVNCKNCKTSIYPITKSNYIVCYIGPLPAT